jgi:hypothetical protein
MMIRFSIPPTMLAFLALGAFLSFSSALAAGDAVEKAKKIAVEAPEKLPEESPLTAEQVAAVLKG